MNNKIKKLLSLILVLVLIFIFAGCGKNKNSASITLPEGKTTAEIGDIIKFGKYEQDNNISNGNEPIEWLVLDIKDCKALVISNYALDCKQYYPSDTDITWENCTLRNWLNNNFLSAAFSDDEKTMIPTVMVSADENPDSYAYPGNATQDQVFLLSITEANKYFSSDNARKCKPTDYAVAKGTEESDEGYCGWWLRSPGGNQTRAADVSRSSGRIDENGNDVDYVINAVRPALWIDLS